MYKCDVGQNFGQIPRDGMNSRATDVTGVLKIGICGWTYGYRGILECERARLKMLRGF